MKLLCRWFGHKYGAPQTMAWDPNFGRMTLECCVRCGDRRVEDDEDRRQRKFALGDA